MIPRYTRPEMGSIWTEENRFQIWMEIELCACEAMAEQGLVPTATARKLREAEWKVGEADAEAIRRIEKETRHDVIAFLTHLERKMGPDARFLHMGMTSSDVLDTALAVQLRKAGDLILSGLDDLSGAVSKQARKHRDTVMVGRSHGIHAEPTTFGLVLAIWYAELGRQRERVDAAIRSVATGKLSGAVGTFAHLPLGVETSVCKRLGLNSEPVSNQVVQRDRHAGLFCALANLGATLEKMAVNIRHLQRTEVAEAGEPFAKGQRGSSAMPHKKNPIGCENLTGVARMLRSYAQAALENVALWHERDISHSSVERVICPDATILVDYALARMTRIMSGLEVDADRMKSNMELTGGLIFSQTVLLALVKKGMERQEAYEIVQKAAMESWNSKEGLREILGNREQVVKLLGDEGLAACFDTESLLQRTREIFERVFT